MALSKKMMDYVCNTAQEAMDYGLVDKVLYKR